MNRIAKIFSLISLLVALSSVGYSQATVTQTTLSSAVNGNGLYSGLSTNVDTAITLASVTGIVAPTPSNAGTIVYIEKEAMQTISVNATTKVVNVVRGVQGTAVNPHPANQMVLFGSPNQFFQYDPTGNCLSTAIVSTPWINVLTGRQWLCSSVSNTWVPGWGNAGDSGAPLAVGPAVASAAAQITPSSPLFHITGTAAITGFLIPVGFNATALGGGSFCVVPDGAFTTTTANNIAIASTAVVNRQICWLWDATNSKFVPSY
jgi:hypothetical protein